MYSKVQFSFEIDLTDRNVKETLVNYAGIFTIVPDASYKFTAMDEDGVRTTLVVNVPEEGENGMVLTVRNHYGRDEYRLSYDFDADYLYKRFLIALAFCDGEITSFIRWLYREFDGLVHKETIKTKML